MVPAVAKTNGIFSALTISINPREGIWRMCVRRSGKATRSPSARLASIRIYDSLRSVSSTADFRKVESCAGNSRHLGYRLRFTLTGGRRRNIRRCGCRHRSQYQPGSSTAHEDCAANRFKKMRMRISSLHRPPNRCFAKAGAASRQPAKFSFRERKSLQRILASAASSLYRRRGCQLQLSLREITYTLV